MKFVEFIKKHCFLVISLTILLVVTIVGIVVTKNLFFSSKGDVFGNRLDGIEEHQVTDSDISKIKNDLGSLEQISSIENNIVGKRINFIIKVKSEVDVITSKGYADKILENLSDDITKFYDIQVMITNEDEENQNYPIIGYKHKTKAGFTF